MLELVSSAGSPEGVIAAVQNGADAVCFGFKDFNAYVDAVNFTYDEFGRAVEYCRIRGVKAYLTQDSLAFDRELQYVARNTRQANHYGVDAVIVQDIGVMRAVRQAVPDMPVYGSPRMCIHNLEGVKMAAAIGLRRVTLAPELTRKEIYHICKHTPIEIDVIVHSNLCMCYPGQCYMSTLVCENSDSRGHCDKPCQWPYKDAGHEFSHQLSLKDNCLVRYIDDLHSIGVTSISIEGRNRRSEYTALITGMYSKALRNSKPPTKETLQTLKKTFSKKGFTDAYYTDSADEQMLGTREEDKRIDTPLFMSTRKLYLNGEFQRVPIRFVGSVTEGKPAKLAAADDKKNGAVAYGPIPEPAFHKELTSAMLQTELYKTGGTPFICLGVRGRIEPGLSLPMSAFTDMRVALFEEILEQRKIVAPYMDGDYTPSEETDTIALAPDVNETNAENTPVIYVSVTKVNQISEEMIELEPALIYIPIAELNYEHSILQLQKLAESKKTNAAIVLPRVIHDYEKKAVAKLLDRAKSIGINEALVSNLGHIQFAKSHRMFVRGDVGLNVYNSETLYSLKKLGLKSATFSFELRLLEIRSISKPIDTEIITYGRLPLMYTENCIVRNCTQACTCESFVGLVDERGFTYPILPEYGHRNILFHSRKLFLADKPKAINTLGVHAQRLNFTTENAVECAAVLGRYMGKNNFSPQSRTRGVYFKERKNVL